MKQSKGSGINIILVDKVREFGQIAVEVKAGTHR